MMMFFLYLKYQKLQIIEISESLNQFKNDTVIINNIFSLSFWK
jgi:hypothetical protein